jgi:putative ABC transport system permease protein
VILTAEVDYIMFGREIFMPSFGYSIALTFLFAIIVNAVMYFKLKKIDMVESLKSVE